LRTGKWELKDRLLNGSVVSREAHATFCERLVGKCHRSTHPEHAAISKAYKFDWYFCHPFCSGERGLNENTNGLIRDFLPKGTDFNLIRDEEIMEIQTILNSRPRKALKFKRPVYLFVDLWAQAANQDAHTANVA
jgi:hypothetical protein